MNLSAADVTALSGAIVAIIGAVSAFIAVLRHNASPTAHTSPLPVPSSFPAPVAVSSMTVDERAAFQAFLSAVTKDHPKP